MRRYISGNQVRRNVRYICLLIIFVVTMMTLSTPVLYDQVIVQYQPMQKFSYSPDIDLDTIISHYRFGQPLPQSMANVRPSNPRVFRFTLGNLRVCQEERIELLILVKTTHSAGDQRDAIRRTWGNAMCYPDRRARVLFLLGVEANRHLEKTILGEQALHGDILQQNFRDNYYNNTLKMMMGFEFLSEHCSTAQFVVLVDHDYLLNPSNLVRFIANVHPRLLPRFLAGYVWYAPVPKRTPGSKWRLSREAYPFNLFPNYAEAGTLIVSSEFAKDLYIAMQFTKYHKFDDIFLGIILHKLHIAPIHSSAVLHLRPKEIPPTFISSHGFDSADDLVKVWEKSSLLSQCAKVNKEKRRRKRGI